MFLTTTQEGGTPMEARAISKEDVIQYLEGITLLELKGLVKELEERFGVSAQPVMMAGAGMMAPTQATSAQPEEEEKTEFDAVLSVVGENKIQVIKVVREITGLGLKEAKDLVEAAPKSVKTAVPKEEAETIKSKLEGVGAKVEIK